MKTECKNCDQPIYLRKGVAEIVWVHHNGYALCGLDVIKNKWAEPKHDTEDYEVIQHMTGQTYEDGRTD